MSGRVIVVGGGIAGLSAVWFARRRGFDATLVDAGIHRASTVPVALVNPVRGRTGRVVANGVDGMHETFALVDALRAEGHSIACGRGVFRPLLDEDSRERAAWDARLPPTLRWRWHARAPASLGLLSDAPAIELLDAGWIAAGDVVAALTRHASRVVRDTATRVEPRAVVLASGERLAADHVVWCGGAWGASRVDGLLGDGRYDPGSLVVAAGRVAGAPLTFGRYAVPRDDATLFGPTRETSRTSFVADEVSDDAVRALGVELARVLRDVPPLAPAWRGVRLGRLSSTAAAALDGVATIAGLGSSGFLLAPLAARAWAATLGRSL